MKTLILIAGVARSGSTATDLILGNRPDALSLGEIHAWYRPFRAHHRRPTCSCGSPVDCCPHWGPIGKPPARRLHEHLASMCDVEMVIDSSKNLGWIRDAHRWAKRRGMQVDVVLPWRGPEAIAHSYWKRDLLDWPDNVEGYMRRLSDLGVPWRSLIFDRLITEPEHYLSEFYAPLGFDYLPGQERFWEGDFHIVFGSGGTRSQVGTTASLASTELPPDFEAYWAALPCDVRSRMARLDATIRQGCPSPRTATHLPRWYVKHRLIAARDRLSLTLQPNHDLR